MVNTERGSDDGYIPWMVNTERGSDDGYIPWMVNTPRESSREEHSYDPSMYEVYDPTLSQEDEPEAELPSQSAQGGEDAPAQGGGDELVQPIVAEAPESHIGSLLNAHHPHAPVHSDHAPVHSDDLPPAEEPAPVLASDPVPYDPALYQSLSTSEKRVVLNARYDLEFDRLFGFNVDFLHAPFLGGAVGLQPCFGQLREPDG